MTPGRSGRLPCMRLAATTVVLRPAMSLADARHVVERVEVLLRADRAVVCDVAGDDLAVVDVLARVRLLAQRLGACDRLRVTGLARVAELAELAGLGQVLGETEPREQ
jgi:hypothetical protein